MDLHKIFVWNCRGAASPNLFRNCKQFVDVHRPGIFAIFETRCNPSRLQKTFRLLGYDGFAFSQNRGFAGGIAVGWKIEVVGLVALRNEFQFIHFEVPMQHHSSWFLTLVYASPVEELRTELWRDISDMAASMHGNWLLAGDFNDIVDSSERRGGGPINTRKCHLFRDRIQQCGLIDMGSVGSKFTWKGAMHGVYDRAYARLDRSLCNDLWRTSFPNAFVRTLPRVNYSL